MRRILVHREDEPLLREAVRLVKAAEVEIAVIDMRGYRGEGETKSAIYDVVRHLQAARDELIAVLNESDATRKAYQ